MSRDPTRGTESIIERIWAQLKAWARDHAHDVPPPGFDEALIEVKRVSREASSVLLQEDVVAFYAAETVEMMERARDLPRNERGRKP